MCGGIHHGEVEGLAMVSVERWSCNRGAHVWWNELWAQSMY